MNSFHLCMQWAHQRGRLQSFISLPSDLSALYRDAKRQTNLNTLQTVHLPYYIVLNWTKVSRTFTIVLQYTKYDHCIMQTVNIYILQLWIG
jgi:hypothetical protein